MRKISRPKIRIEQNDFDKFFCEYISNIIKEENCKNCDNFYDCIIWKDEDFNQFCKDNEFCNLCGYNPLERGYLYVRWGLDKSGLISKKFIERIGYICCFCAKKKGLKRIDNIEKLFERDQI